MSITQTPEQKIASDQLDYLRENESVCANISVRAGRHPWVRWNGSMYEIVEKATRWGALEVTACEKDALLNLFAENPVHIKPAERATCSPPDSGRRNVWEMVDENGEHVTYTNPDAGADL